MTRNGPLATLRAGVSRWGGRHIERKTPDQLAAMHAAGQLVARALAEVAAQARAGVSTLELDEVAEQVIRDGGGVPSFLGYHGFPASICASVNDQIVHGIPSKSQVLADGDLLSVDCGAIVDGWHGDSAITLPVGEVSPADLALSAACREALDAGIAAAVPGARLTDISHAVQTAAEAAARRDGVSYGIIAEYGGHGIGTAMHMDPFLPNLGQPGRGPKLPVGGVLAVEPMLTAGTAETRTLDDNWTVVTADASRAVHWEHTVAITSDGPWILTAPVTVPT
ncbi:type I methionyl aminopeptidase [Pseudonocardia acaciae]|uniref:type I methionyl aminopeptidase n=1 Tax=Pseudonocardia acaciae TaxID=551276 RepID=UPI0009FF54B4|nr:type I methionyl aminopeptidase [Pseudonocardia acaciae]